MCICDAGARKRQHGAGDVGARGSLVERTPSLVIRVRESEAILDLVSSSDGKKGGPRRACRVAFR